MKIIVGKSIFINIKTPVIKPNIKYFYTFLYKE